MDFVLDDIVDCKIYATDGRGRVIQFLGTGTGNNHIRGCQLQPMDQSWHNYASYDGEAKLGQVLYNNGLMQGIVTKITYDREKKWWQFWIRRKQTGCYVEWRER